MAIDAGIYSNVGRHEQPQNPLASLAQVQQLKQLQQQGERADRAEQRQNALMQAMQTPEFQQGDIATRQRLAYGAGDVDAATKIGTAGATQARDQREAQRIDLEMAIKGREAMSGGFMQLAQDPSQAPMLLRQMVDQRIMTPEYAEKVLAGASSAPDPRKFFAMGAQAAVSAKDQLAQQLQQQQQALTASGQVETQRHNQATESTAATSAATGQGNLAVNQQGLALRQKEQAAGRVPQGYRALADGTMEFIPGGPADPASKVGGGKPLTEGQSKSLVYAARMSEANDIFDALEKAGTTKQIPGSTAPIVGGTIMALGGADNQQLVQGKRDFLTAVLRRESGAVISDAETANGDKQYFPQVGDDPKTIAQKKRNRQIAMRGIAADVPDADRRIAEVRGVPEKPAPTAPTGGAPLRVTNAADYASVPSGATYTTPDGKTRRKP